MTVVNRNMNRRLQHMLYALKRLYGAPIDVYKLGGQSTDHDTGVRTVNKTVYNVNRAIVLTAKVARESVQTLPIISANKAFAYGGVYDTGTRLFIVDRTDPTEVILPDLNTSDWVVYDGVKYEIKVVEAFEFDAAVVITGKAVLGDAPEKVHNLRADNLIRVTDSGDVS